jgi:hypothetical protein
MLPTIQETEKVKLYAAMAYPSVIDFYHTWKIIQGGGGGRGVNFVNPIFEGQFFPNFFNLFSYSHIASASSLLLLES